MFALPILIPATTLGFAVLAALVGVWRAGAATAAALVGAATALVLSVVGLAAALPDSALRHQLGGWPPPVGIEYVLDPLSGYVAVIVCLIGLLAIVYPARAGFGRSPERGAPLASLTLLLLTGLLGVAMSGDLFNLFVFLEVYAIASYALIGLGGDRALFASFRYLIVGTAGSGFYLLGVGFLYFSTGSLNMEHVAELLPALAGSPTVTGALVLIVVGLAIKAALFPLHVWLPDAHSYAPPAVAALLAAVQVKVAAYALVRIFHTVFAPGEVAPAVDALALLGWFGAAGIVAGSVAAILQRDLKRLLAYSTVAQLGYIAVGIALASPLGLIGALAESAPTGPILICGGGNFGTLWPRHQEFRIELLERFPVHLGHLTERYGTLIILVLGESFIKSITVQPSPPMTFDAVIYSFPGVLLVFALWWLYFEDTHAGGDVEGEKHGVLRSTNAVPWLYTHLPLSLGLISFGVAKKKLFEATGGGSLYPEYVALFLGSLALFSVLLGVIAGTGNQKDTMWRVGSGIVLLLLIPAVIGGNWSATALMLASTLIIGTQVIREVWQSKIRK